MPVGQPLHVSLASDLVARIESGEWPPGARLPAVRDLAKQLGVSPFTVSRAVRALSAAGRVETIHGKGTYVTRVERPAPPPPQNLSWQNALLRKPPPTRADAIVHPLVRQYDAPPDVIVLASGGETADILPVKSLQTAWRGMLNNLSSSVLGGWSASGEAPIREWMADYLGQTGIHTSPERVLVTAGGQQALSLAAQTLLQPDDTVLVERPTYPFALSIFESFGVRCVDIPVDEEGLRVDIAEDLMERFRPCACPPLCE
jgi:DNA-binding transcriptional MocR family regulator